VTRHVDVHIDDLVLEGVEGRDVGASVSRELRRLIGERGLSERLASTERVEAPLSGPATPTSIAAAVHEGLGRCSS
jgi:hypothetical protein